MLSTFKIDNDEVIKLTVKLGKLNRGAIPNAVRNTLNNAAFETRNEIPNQGRKKFITRNKNFLKFMTTVDKANGFNLKSMVATVGIDASKGKKTAEGLAAQEFGGNLYTSRLVPHNDARTSKSHNKRVKRKNWLNKLNAHNASGAYRAHKGTRSSKFVSAVMSTAKAGKKYMILENRGTGILYEIKSLKSNVRSGKTSFKVEKLYVLKKNSSANVKGVRFIRASKDVIIKKIPKYYKNNAEFQIKKHWK